MSATKLANFAEIECFVLVAGPEDCLVDDREFNVPVITPLELEVALGLREWGDVYSTDFADLRALAASGADGGAGGGAGGGGGGGGSDATRRRRRRRATRPCSRS